MDVKLKMKTEFIFDPEYLAEETENFRTMLRENKGREDLGAHGAEIIAASVKANPKRYRRYGPYWWRVKEILIERGLTDGEMTNPEISAIYRGQNDDETIAAAQLFYDFYRQSYFDGNNQFALDPDETEDWTLYDPDYEQPQ